MKKTIAYITGIHLDEEFPIDQGVDSRKNWEIILKDISSKKINEIIFGGDIGERSSHKWFFESLEHYNVSITLGNHDYFSDIIKYYKNGSNRKPNELYYCQEGTYFKFIFMDSSSGSISQGQFEWLKKELSTTKNILLFLHHPILGVDAEVDKRFALNERDKIKAELLNFENKVTIFCGHYHFDDDITKNNIRQYITPASSYQVEKIPNEIKIRNKVFGYRIIELNERRFSTELIMFESK